MRAVFLSIVPLIRNVTVNSGPVPYRTITQCGRHSNFTRDVFRCVLISIRGLVRRLVGNAFVKIVEKWTRKKEGRGGRRDGREEESEKMKKLLKKDQK